MGNKVNDKVKRRKARVRIMPCAACGKFPGSQIHHKDGNPKNEAAYNMVPLCKVCHQGYHDRESYGIGV